MRNTNSFETHPIYDEGKGIKLLNLDHRNVPYGVEHKSLDARKSTDHWEMFGADVDMNYTPHTTTDEPRVLVVTIKGTHEQRTSAYDFLTGIVGGALN